MNTEQQTKEDSLEYLYSQAQQIIWDIDDLKRELDEVNDKIRSIGGDIKDKA